VVLDDHARVLKLLVKRHRDLGRLKSKAACRLHALLMELEPGGMAKEMTVTRANEILDRIEPSTPDARSIESLSHEKPSPTSPTTRHR
jgi:transposase